MPHLSSITHCAFHSGWKIVTPFPLHVWALPKWSLPKLFVWLKEWGFWPRKRPCLVFQNNAPKGKKNKCQKCLLGTSHWLELWVIVFKLSPAVVLSVPFLSPSITILQLCQSKAQNWRQFDTSIRTTGTLRSIAIKIMMISPMYLPSKEKQVMKIASAWSSWSHMKPWTIVSCLWKTSIITAVACRCLVASHQQQGAPNIIRGANGCSQTYRPDSRRFHPEKPPGSV